jgi:hypothetical protein
MGGGGRRSIYIMPFGTLEVYYCTVYIQWRGGGDKRPPKVSKSNPDRSLLCFVSLFIVFGVLTLE